jgi:hypothetical protein
MNEGPGRDEVASAQVLPAGEWLETPQGLHVPLDVVGVVVGVE